jgi:hypothetical protein
MHTFRSASTSTPRRYRITQLAFVQEHALGEAQNRIKRLEWEVQQAQQASQQKSGSASGGGFLSGLFGPPPDSDARNQGQPQGQGYYPQSAPPPPQCPPSYQPGIFQRQGPGFLSSALTTAAGVAGGVVAGNALMSLFSPHQGGLDGGAPRPWATPPAPSQDYVDTGSWDQGGAAEGSGNQDYDVPPRRPDPD